MPPPGARAGSSELAELVEALHANIGRLEQLTAGEVDTIARPDGQIIMLPRSLQYWREQKADKQTAILNALPANIALLDHEGCVTAVNQAWRQFASANGLEDPAFGVGTNYLALCDLAPAPAHPEAAAVAQGIRAVLQGDSNGFFTECPCDSPTEQRWVQMNVAPVTLGLQRGAVVMHMDVTAQRRAETERRASELRFRQMADSIGEAFFLVDAHSSQIFYMSPAYEKISGRSCSSLYARAESWFEVIHPDDRAASYARFTEHRAGSMEAIYEDSYRLLRPDGSVRWIDVRAYPVHDESGVVVRLAGVAKDVTESRRIARELDENRRRLGSIVASAMDAIVTVDETSHIVLSNPAAQTMFGYAGDEMQGLSLDVLLPARLVAQHHVDLQAFAMAADVPRRMHALRQVNGIRSNGEEFPIEVSISKDVQNGHWFYTATLRDITARLRDQARIERLNHLYAMLSGINGLIVRLRDRKELFRQACLLAVEQGGFLSAAIGVVDPQTLDGQVMAWSGADGGLLDHARLTARADMPESERPACRALRLSVPVVCNHIATEPTLAPVREALLAGGCQALACFPITASDRPDAVMVLFASEADVFDGEEMQLLEELAGDLSFALDHIEKAERLSYLAFFDALTGLANRSLFLERVRAHIRSAAAADHVLAVLMFDVARFKNLNDSMVQQAGDALLQQVAQWLSAFGSEPALLARLEADHFALVVPEVGRGGDVSHLVEAILKRFGTHPFHVNDAVFRITARIGVALFPADGDQPDILLNKAEAALKRAKQQGDPYLVFTQNLGDAVAGLPSLENQLRQAIDNGEFVLYYQPKLHLASGAVHSAEALIRWNDPRTGLVAPAQFIPVLEATGLIHEVGRWALRQAMADGARWQALGLQPVRVAVNVSPLQLRHRGFVGEVEQLLADRAVSVAGLELEITESVIMSDIEHNMASLRDLRGMGLSIAIDDFGTGFSSLSYLARLPVDTLKIDRSFIVEMTTSPQGLALVSTIVNLAHALQLKVVAEGVETQEQSALLRLLGCDEIQGYLFSRPLPASDFGAGFLQPVAAH